MEGNGRSGGGGWEERGGVRQICWKAYFTGVSSAAVEAAGPTARLRRVQAAAKGDVARGGTSGHPAAAAAGAGPSGRENKFKRMNRIPVRNHRVGPLRTSDASGRELCI